MSDVLVIGAGIAGLRAALHLAEHGLSVTVLEAKERVGGRILTVEADGAHVELGAEFVHGVPPDTFDLLKRYGLESYELDGDDLFYKGEGEIATGNEGHNSFSLVDEMTEWSELHPHRDPTFAEYLAEQAIPAAQAHGAVGYVEGFNAADHRVIGVRSLAVQQRAEDSSQGERMFHLTAGYSALSEAMANDLRSKGVETLLNTAVTAIEWNDGSVTLKTERDETHHAKLAVVTLPLGVLQKRSVSIAPEPLQLLHHADSMRMGPVCRVVLLFHSRWWAELDHPQHRRLQKLSFLLPIKRTHRDVAGFDVFWTPYPSETPMLTAWAGGPAAENFNNLSKEQIGEIALRNLEEVFALAPGLLDAKLRSVHLHDWQRDPYAGGAYSYVPAGAMEASQQMAIPVENTLFFAGEHTDVSGHWGTVHGALRSGLRAAQQALKAIRQ